MVPSGPTVGARLTSPASGRRHRTPPRAERSPARGDPAGSWVGAGWAGRAGRLVAAGPPETELVDAPAHVLSAGERQRVGLARALVNRPSLLLADEPTSSLDPDAAEQIIALLKEVHRDGTTVLVATHDEDALASFDCRTLMMYQGRVFEEDDARVASSL